MKTRLAARALAVLAGAFLVSCVDDTPPTAPQVNVYTYVSNNAVNNAAGPTQPGAPGTGNSALITDVTIGKYGEEGPNPPTNDPGTVRLGNRALLTCTPKCGPRDCTPEEHGSSPSFFDAVSNQGKLRVTPDQANAFNLEATGLATGEPAARLLCTVLGKSSRERTLMVLGPGVSAVRLDGPAPGGVQ